MSMLDVQKPNLSPTSHLAPTSPTMRKRQRTLDHVGNAPPAEGHPIPLSGPAAVGDDAFIADHEAVDSAGDDDDDDEGGLKPKDKKAGRRKIKIEYIQDKSRRHITFSKRKAGTLFQLTPNYPSHNMPIYRHYEKGNIYSRFVHPLLSHLSSQAYELSTLTGTQVLLLVVSETGLVYTFTTAKLQPLVTQPEGKNLIQACLNAPHGSLPSSQPVGTQLGRPSGSMNMSGPPPSANIPGGLSISGSATGGAVKDDDQEDEHHDDTSAHGGRATAGDKRRRRGSSTSGPTSASSNNRGATSPHSPNSVIPPPLSIPAGSQPPGSQQTHPSHQQQTNPQIALGSPTSPQQQHQQVSPSSTQQYSPSSYHPVQQQQHHQPQQHDNMYPHMISPGGYSYPGPGGPAPPGGAAQQLGGLAAAAAQHGHWPQQPQVGQGGHYGGRR